MAKKKGDPKTGGRVAGTPNKITSTVRETVLAVFNDLQKDPKVNLKAWAQGQPTEFYRIASKLIPTDLKAELTGADGHPIEHTYEITLKI